MSNNQCNTCNHYKPVHAANPSGDCTLYPQWLDVPAQHYCGQWASVQKEDALTTGLNIDWSEVPEGYDWVTQNSNGDIYAWSNRPCRIAQDYDHWFYRDVARDAQPYSIGTAVGHKVTIEYSIAKRPTAEF